MGYGVVHADQEATRCQAKWCLVCLTPSINLGRCTLHCVSSIRGVSNIDSRPQGLFKMDTIGDAYVAAGWLHSLDPQEAAER